MSTIKSKKNGKNEGIIGTSKVAAQALVLLTLMGASYVAYDGNVELAETQAELSETQSLLTASGEELKFVQRDRDEFEEANRVSGEKVSAYAKEKEVLEGTIGEYKSYNAKLKSELEKVKDEKAALQAKKIKAVADKKRKAELAATAPAEKKAVVEVEKEVQKAVQSTPSKKVETEKPQVATASNKSVEGYEGWRSMTVSATGYTAYCAGCSGITATGIDLRSNPNQKVIAVDPNVIPLGSQVYVEGYGYAIAGDTGGAIKGSKIDLYMQSRSEALAWGRRNVTIYIK